MKTKNFLLGLTLCINACQNSGSYLINKICIEKGKSWTEEEDKLLKELVSQHGTNAWYPISTKLPRYNARQCRDRWYYLDGSYAKRDWTKDEEDILRKKHNEFGSQWEKIAVFLPDRTPRACCIHWCILKKGKSSRYSTTRRYSRDWTKSEKAILLERYNELGSQWKKIAQFLPGKTPNACRMYWRKCLACTQNVTTGQDTTLSVVLNEETTSMPINPPQIETQILSWDSPINSLDFTSISNDIFPVLRNIPDNGTSNLDEADYYQDSTDRFAGEDDFHLFPKNYDTFPDF